MKLDRLTTTGKACAGCRAALCCRSDFMVTEEEIARVRSALTGPNLLMLAANLDERHIPGATDAPCPFLDDATNRCAIYDDRPAACRVYGSDFPAPRCMDPTPRNMETFRANRDRLWRWIGARPLVSWFDALQRLKP